MLPEVVVQPLGYEGFEWLRLSIAMRPPLPSLLMDANDRSLCGE